jgi:putative tryptophan/tyrosine transport system substrate-binding protein
MHGEAIKRRTFISLLGGAAVAWPIAARAQQAAERMRRIGVLMSVENDPDGKAQLSGFTQGLAEIGWTDGRNLRMEVRWGGGDVIGYGPSRKNWSPYSPT